MSKGKLLWMKFYPGDWRSDPAVRGVSLAARGLWIDMLMLMHEASPRGVLMVAGRIVGAETLARLCSADPGEVAALLDELETAGVFSRKKNGAIYSRRMELDEARSRKASENGRRGGNPALVPNSDLAGDGNSDLPLFGESTENRGRIRGESDENPIVANTEDETEIDPSVKGRVKPKRLETRDKREERTPKVPAKITPDAQSVEACVNAWNALAIDCSLAKVQLLSDARRSKLLARLKDVGGLEGWFAMCDRIRNSKFLRGEATSWRVSFDWVLSQTNLAKIMEGNFDDRKPTGKDARQSTSDAMADERRRILESAGDLEREDNDHERDRPSSRRRD